MDKTTFQELLQRYNAGTASAEEEAFMEAYYEAFNERPDIIAALSADEQQKLEGKLFTELLISFNTRPVTQPGTPIASMRYRRRWWAAAAALALLAGSVYWFIAVRNNNIPSPLAVKTADIQPGREGAILTLANGAKISLDTISNATIALQGGITAKVANGTLYYEGVGNEVLYNTMSTPKGRQFHVTLLDGTDVWLNAASSIRFPIVFNTAERRVEVTGEAYFEVAADKQKPFNVSVNGKAGINVLGTHFNVNAYNNENDIVTTLLQGAVRVTASGKALTLSPGQQAKMAHTGITLVNDVDITQVVAWKNGAFDFNGASLEQVMHQLERWYDIEIVYEKGIPDLHFEGKMSRNMSLSGLLKALEASEVHFRIEGKRLVVMP